MKAHFTIGILFFLIFSTGCFEPPDDLEPVEAVGEVDGLKPIYAPFSGLKTYPQVEAQPIVNLGKIYYKAPYIFVNESARGVHIIDNANPNSPQKISFLTIPGNNDIAIKDNFLYADNLRDMVIFDISDINDIKFVNRVLDINPNEEDIIFPPGFTGWFECVDEGKGEVVGWEATVLVNPTCFK